MLLIRIFFFLTVFESCTVFSAQGQVAQPPMVLWYKQPATLGDSLPYKNGKTTQPFDDRHLKGWVEALPIGNGRMGAMVFGGIGNERLQLNEESLWAGYQHDENNPKAAAALPIVRRLIFEGKEDSAKLIGEENMLGVPKNVSPYQPMGDLWISFPTIKQEAVTNYYRDLSIDGAVAGVRYQHGDVLYKREVFASHPDQVIVIRLTASHKGSITMNLLLDREKDATATVSNNKLVLRGRLQVPDEKGVNRGMAFETQVVPVVKGGKVTTNKNQFIITAADEVMLLLSQATSYRGTDPEKSCTGWLKAAARFSYDELKKRHQHDYRSLYERVKINLNAIPESEALRLPTDQRIQQTKTGKDGDDYLSALQYQYSRYLMIASSRPGDLPANLQGLWNQHLKPAWDSDYHTNINFQMNYWFVEAANLAECHEPLISYLDTLAHYGKRTAVVHYNAGGWVAHHASDLFGYTAPVAGVHGVWPVGGAWTARHSYEHYLYNSDKEFLRQKAYPLLRGAAEFFLDFLVEVPAGLPFAGKLVTNPSHSPENAFERPDGVQSQFTYGATMDMQIIRDLFDNCLESISILQNDDKNFDRDFQKRLMETKELLLPVQISASGRIQEWVEDYKELEVGHRHISHLYSLHPDNLISPGKTPELAQAALKTLATRLKGDPSPSRSIFGAFDSYLNGEKGTGWGRAWISLFYSRLNMGEEAYRHHRYLQANFALPNLLGIAHGTYQIDNVFGNAAAIGEMLIQSQEGFLHLLPALPAKWKEGAVSGLRAIGGFEVAMRWRGSKLEAAEITSTVDGVCRVKPGRQVRKIISGNEAIRFNIVDDGVVAFSTKKGKGYRLIF